LVLPELLALLDGTGGINSDEPLLLSPPAMASLLPETLGPRGDMKSDSSNRNTLRLDLFFGKLWKWEWIALQFKN
jgi:hypothetical protein